MATPLMCSALITLLLLLQTITPASARNLTWYRPHRYTHWQWQLDDSGTISTVRDSQDAAPSKVKWYDIDLDTAPDAIPSLRRRIPGVKVICYISAGTWEPFRAEEDARRGIKQSDFNGLKGKSFGGAFDDERWIDIRNSRVKTIMTKRLNYAKTIGCDGVEPDNVGAYTEDTGFPISKAVSLSYSKWFARAAHNRNMNVGLKNSLGLVQQLKNDYDWFLNEQCNAFNECGVYSNLPKRNRPVFGVEYCDASAEDNGVTLDPGCYCPGMLAAGYQWLIKTTALNARGISCGKYCQNNPCPGRAGRSNCRANQASVCFQAGV
mmetsp:Transcript_10122/g.30303  ORF Transcript_10122/g.30303 Transcript_10122/m.30303 type:complete len:321 (+) Transcript_10122:164-1126(+)|eukprot:CAMPEP_0206147902 /NCGR_PEP_ID=MMETSP1473-20131121/34955_1 /ASSEMBLY_ACC=CAM_ASM_001109 /TAXON_ID=1461547 /ORGANISM="Stichococcus sp, Strain RCC1054" /LENGTH=320 /DNA_ID=CAMNT_0053545047 /DNA_START=155 /DNA_END=1117 /DNA_ORIENTATION=+